MMITFFKTDARGTSCYYSLHDRQGHLFSSYAFTVHWGKGLDMGREFTYTFDTRSEMDLKIRAVIRDRLKNGYRVLYSYFRDSERADIQPMIRKYSVS